MSESSFAGKRVTVMGLGRFGGGVGVARWLAAQGAAVTVTDTAAEADLVESIGKLADLPIRLRLGGHDEADFTGADLVVINPAVDREKSSYVQAALRAGVQCTTEMNLFLERCRGKVIGVTGSVGKSTTTTLIHEALFAGMGRPAADAEGGGWSRLFLGGNIGRSLLQELPAIRAEDWVVLELSSFMLEETPRIQWSPHVAVVTNVFPNHLDRHGTMARYTAAKQNILRFQKAGDVAVLNNDHELVSRWVHLARGRVVKYTTRGPAEKQLNLAMPGDHNRSNAAAAMAVVEVVAGEGTALDREAARHAVENFPGLAHRLQWVHAWQLAPQRPVKFYNDSKATTPEASITALEAFAPRTAIFIVGGYDKQSDLSAFEAELARRAAGVVGIGQTGQGIVERIGRMEGAPRAAYAGKLEAAMTLAGEWARTDPRVGAIVLSPACASWDQFANYEQRGELFSKLAQAIR